jgi:GSCFA family
MDDSRRRLTDWTINTSQVTSQTDFKGQWFKGEHFHSLQTKAKLWAANFEPVLVGWKPERPIIGPDTLVMALGSCFARYFTLWLGDHGFNRSFPKSPYDALAKFELVFENVAVIAQQFRWALNKFDAQHAFWIAKDQQRVHPTDEVRLLARETLQQAEVLIVTLGLSEVWYDRITGEPMWRAVPVHSFDPSRHAFKVLSVAETVAALEQIEAIRREHLPSLKIVYTVSPVRFRTTFRPVSALTANCASKAILRAGLDEFLRAHWDEVNRTYFYFPSYEIVTELLDEPFCADMRHLYPHVPERLMALFAAHYTSFEADSSVAPKGDDHSDLRRTLLALEEKIEELQHVCDERMDVIQVLDKAARERLELIERLHAELHGTPR